jgi:two-component system phosphate regulon sensor histidine kinase PhoR
MIFTQVIYLKLVDKATIIDRLKKSEKLYAQEKEVSKLKDEFISTVSHELKTPLTSMKLYVGLLKEKKLGALKKKQVDALSVVNDETDRLNALITDLLDLSRLESGKSKLELSEFDLRKLVNNKLYLNIARKKKIAVNVDIPKDFIVAADKGKIKQVFINLFSNSVKFTPGKGHITVAAKMFETEWEFSVSDNGKGIEKHKIPKLFDKFFQAEDFMTRKEGGTGLGLAIVKHIVEMHKGKIHVQSEAGKGTKVSIMFPKLSRY